MGKKNACHCFGEGWQAREWGEWDVECSFLKSRFRAKFKHFLSSGKNIL